MKFNGPVTIQHGTGHVATTTKTDNTGRAAETGANGGHSEASTKNTTAAWLVGVLVVGAAIAGWVLKSRMAMVLLLLMALASQASAADGPLKPQTAQADEPKPRRYSYKESRRTQRRYNRIVRYYRRINRQDLRDLQQDRKLQAKRLKRDHP
ncbi:hypothetical protein [Hymenobacter sp. YC55]|uniref:hypothetical protein n=1 Tax=Hymenobacter sp. YC55 TaxID=3034019 RepID=UPI0023FA2482|nr:hypothetical protein [Hymenobacter sp. YC55]